MKLKKQEFLALKQGAMSVSEYPQTWEMIKRSRMTLGMD
jgi:hypothetical protein